MRRVRVASALLLSLSVSAAARGEEVAADGRIESVGLFKNGLAVVHRTVRLPGPGTYRVDGLARPVHGTFWVDGDVPVDAQVTTRVVDDADATDGPTDFQQELAGQDVTVHLKGKDSAPVVGRVAVVKPAVAESKGFASAVAEQNGYGYGTTAGPATPTYLLLDTAVGRTYVDRGDISAVEAKGPKTRRRRRPVLLLTVRPENRQGAIVRIEYLANGLGWAPAYRLKLVDASTFTVEQQAVVRNEMADLTDAEVGLITGFPQVKFAAVTSPAAADQSWDAFFGQLVSTTPDDQPRFGLAGNAVSQTAGTRTADGPPPAAGATVGDSADLHYEPIGRRTLAVGDALLTSVAAGKGTYARVVQWHVPDRDQDQRYAAGNGEPPPPDDAWDAVRLSNPLAIPMTTGPAEVVDGGRFAGQTSVDYTNPGQSVVVKITKALSVETHSTVAEDTAVPRQPAERWPWPDYVWVTLNGRLTYTNHRPTAVTLEINRDFAGEPISADGKPTQVPRADDVEWEQAAYTLRWTLTVKAGETGTVNYRYRTLRPR